MAVQLQQVDNLQHMEVGVSGPDKANRMYITTGIARTNHSVGSNANLKENYSLHVDPPLTASQFRRAIATAAIAEAKFYDSYYAQNDGMDWRIEEVDADFDDETGKVELHFTLYVEVTGIGNASLESVSFTVTTLAEV